MNARKFMGIVFALAILVVFAFPKQFDNQSTVGWIRFIAIMIAYAFMVDWK